MTKIRIHNPCNEHTRYFRHYNLFWDNFTDYLKNFFDIEENRYYEFANSARFPVQLEKSSGSEFLLLECEYVIENLDNGEFVIMSVADDLTHAILNEKHNPYLRKVLVSQFAPEKILHHTGKYFYKYSAWSYFQSTIIDLEQYYEQRLLTPPTCDKLYFKGAVGNDRTIIYKFDPNILTDFSPTSPENYFTDLITHKVALSVDGRGEFCYRDIECFAIGVPMLRFEFVSKFYNELIPNYHYISLPRPNDMGLFREGTEEHAKLIEQRFLEVVNDTKFLNYISKNARKYYTENCTMNKNIINTFNLLNLRAWL